LSLFGDIAEYSRHQVGRAARYQVFRYAGYLRVVYLNGDFRLEQGLSQGCRQVWMNQRAWTRPCSQVDIECRDEVDEPRSGGDCDDVPTPVSLGKALKTHPGMP